MNKYIVIKKKRKELLNSIAKDGLKTATGIVKASYYASIILKWMAITSSILTLIISLVSSNYLKLVFIPYFIVTFYGLSIAASVLYKGLLSSMFKFRTEESIVVNDGNIIYSYSDTRSPVASKLFSYLIIPEKITEAKYLAKTGELQLFGNIDETVYVAGVVSENNVWAEIYILNYFECDIVDALKGIGMEINIIEE